MTARTKTLALLAAGTTAVGGGLGAAGATASPTDAAPAKGDGTQAQKQHHGKALKKLARALDVRPGELREALSEASDGAGEAGLEKFAAKLGTTPEKVKDAVEKAKDALTGTPAPTEPGQPTRPEQPTTPGQPTTPEQPTTPTAPAEPGAATTQDDGGSTTGETPATPAPGGEGTPGDGERPAPVAPEQKLEAFVAALAKELGVEPAKVTEAGEAAKKAAKKAFVSTLADELDRTSSDVREALAELQDDGSKPGVPGGNVTPDDPDVPAPGTGETPGGEQAPGGGETTPTPGGDAPAPAPGDGSSTPGQPAPAPTV